MARLRRSRRGWRARDACWCCFSRWPRSGFLALRGFPGPRLLVHGAICLFYLAVCRYPPSPITERVKTRILIGGLLCLRRVAGQYRRPVEPADSAGSGHAAAGDADLRDRRGRGAVRAPRRSGCCWPSGCCRCGRSGALVAPLAPRGGHASPESVILVVGFDPGHGESGLQLLDPHRRGLRQGRHRARRAARRAVLRRRGSHARAGGRRRPPGAPDEESARVDQVPVGAHGARLLAGRQDGRAARGGVGGGRPPGVDRRRLRLAVARLGRPEPRAHAAVRDRARAQVAARRARQRRRRDAGADRPPRPGGGGGRQEDPPRAVLPGDERRAGVAAGPDGDRRRVRRRVARPASTTRAGHPTCASGSSTAARA